MVSYIKVIMEDRYDISVDIGEGKDRSVATLFGITEDDIILYDEGMCLFHSDPF